MNRFSVRVCAGLRAVASMLSGLGIVLVLGGCAGPSERFEAEADRLGLIRSVQRGTEFVHTVYRSAGSPTGGVLHVYLDGDGTPWRHGQWEAEDPTPRNPLMLRLLSRDPASSLYLARPCYSGAVLQGECDARLWTAERYSERVVRSMQRAVLSLMARSRHRGVVFLGHSGGGTLAMLLAERILATRAVVTLAGNLDPDAWAAHHRYEPLTGSLNPAKRVPLRVPQLHYVGERDSVVPSHLLEAALAGRPSAELVQVRDFTHVCCWERIWSKVLTRLERLVGDAR